MGKRRIAVALYVDEEDILGKIAEMSALAVSLHHTAIELEQMLTQRNASDSETVETKVGSGGDAPEPKHSIPVPCLPRQ